MTLLYALNTDCWIYDMVHITVCVEHYINLVFLVFKKMWLPWQTGIRTCHWHPIIDVLSHQKSHGVQWRMAITPTLGMGDIECLGHVIGWECVGQGDVDSSGWPFVHRPWPVLHLTWESKQLPRHGVSWSGHASHIDNLLALQVWRILAESHWPDVLYLIKYRDK